MKSTCRHILQSFLLLALFACTPLACTPSLTEASFFTEGNCDACGQLVAETLEGMEGIKAVRWDSDQSLTHVSYRAELLSLEEIQQALADRGFNTQYFDGNPDRRAALPECCREEVGRRLDAPDRLPPGH